MEINKLSLFARKPAFTPEKTINITDIGNDEACKGSVGYFAEASPGNYRIGGWG